MDRHVMKSLTVALVLVLLVSTILATDIRAEETSRQDFGGVGLQVVPTVDGELVVLRVVPGTPAARLGMQPGDLIFQVDEFRLAGSDFGEVVTEHLWGPVGSEVVLHFRRPGQTGDRQVKVQRIRMDPKLTVTPTVQSPGGSGEAGQTQ